MVFSAKRSLQFSVSAAALFVCLAASPAFAQSTSDEDRIASEQEDARDEDIIVTGTNISGVKPVGSQAVVIDREEAERTGLLSAADVVNTIPQVRKLSEVREGGTAAAITNGGQNSSIDIRGIGVDATLILVDGNRTVSTGTNITATNPNQLPLAAIERIEVVTDGASAVYGSDAVAGVVNFVVRKDYQGAEVSIRASDTAGPMNLQGDLTFGTAWQAGGLGRGNILLTYQYSHRDAYLAGKNPLLRYNASPFGGFDARISNENASAGFAPNIVVNTQVPNLEIPRAGTWNYFGVPAGSNNALTASQLRLNDPNLVDNAFYTDYVGDEKRHSATLYLNQELGDRFELFAQANYLDRKVVSRSANGLGGDILVDLPYYLVDPVTLAPTTTPNPYYVANVPGVSQGSPGIPIFGIPATPPETLKVQYATLKDGTRRFVATDESYNVTAGLRAKLGSGWEAEAKYTYGRNVGCTYCSPEGYRNSAALQYQINIGAINPLSTDPLTDAQRDKVFGAQIQRGHNGLDVAQLKFNGPLFTLPGGTVRAAFGGERNKSFAYNESSVSAGIDNVEQVITTKANSYYGRRILSAFGEVYVPLVGDGMNVPLVKSLIVSAAIRHDDYSDAGRSTNPKIGFTWEVADFFKLSGSYGTSYHAPSLAYKNPGAYSSGLVSQLPNNDPRIVKDVDLRPFGIPVATSNTALLFGANEDLRPENATTWSLTGEVEVGAFTFKTTYYNIDYRDRISFPNIFVPYLIGLDPPNYGGYGQFVIPINNPATCSNANPASADPALQPFLDDQVLYSPGVISPGAGLQNFCSIRAVLDSRFINLARAKQDGLDFSLTYKESFGDLFVSSNLAVNYLLNNKEQPVEGEDFIDRIGTFDTPVRWRGRGNVGLYFRGFNANLYGNYFGSYLNTQIVDALGNPAAPQKVPSYTTFDLNLGFQTDFKGRDAGFIKGLRGAFTITNLFDKLPPIAVNANGSGFASALYNPASGAPFGRRYTFQLSASF